MENLKNTHATYKNIKIFWILVILNHIFRPPNLASVTPPVAVPPPLPPPSPPPPNSHAKVTQIIIIANAANIHHNSHRHQHKRNNGDAGTGKVSGRP